MNKKTSIIEATEEINISDNDEPRILYIGLTLNTQEREQLIRTLMGYKDVFAWSYQYMPGIDPEIAQHTIPLLSGSKPVKQKLWKMKPDIALKIEEEVHKQLDVGFIKVIDYPE